MGDKGENFEHMDHVLWWDGRADPWSWLILSVCLSSPQVLNED